MTGTSCRNYSSLIGGALAEVGGWQPHLSQQLGCCVVASPLSPGLASATAGHFDPLLRVQRWETRLLSLTKSDTIVSVETNHLWAHGRGIQGLSESPSAGIAVGLTPVVAGASLRVVNPSVRPSEATQPAVGLSIPTGKTRIPALRPKAEAPRNQAPESGSGSVRLRGL